jgi:hypothetical protein
LLQELLEYTELWLIRKHTFETSLQIELTWILEIAMGSEIVHPVQPQRSCDFLRLVKTVMFVQNLDP